MAQFISAERTDHKSGEKHTVLVNLNSVKEMTVVNDGTINIIFVNFRDKVEVVQCRKDSPGFKKLFSDGTIAQ